MLNKNRFIALVLALLMLLSLCACGKAEADEGRPESDTTQIILTPTEEPEVPDMPEEPAQPGLDLASIAEEMVGEPVADPVEKIGEPSYTDYAPSCLGPGEDGELGYDGFTVYTYREGDTEWIEEVVRAK